MRRVTLEEAQAVFDKRGCTLLSETINNVREKLSFTCTCGRVGSISLDKFKSGQLCSGCRHERMAAAQRHSIEHVRAVFEANGCRLLSNEYRMNKQKLRYVCKCGDEAEIAFAKFQAGQRCNRCKSSVISEKLTGPNNPAWRHDLTEEDRIKERTVPGYNEWRREVFRRDDYTCTCCGVRGIEINAHHVESYARVPEKRTELDNGVTLCHGCHREYHSKIRRNDADRDSFEYFLTDYREPWYAGEIEVHTSG